MFGIAVILTLAICLYLLWPRYDGGGIHYNLALVCTPCALVGMGVIAFLWVCAAAGWLIS